MGNLIVDEAESKMATRIEALKRDLTKIRTGRASLSLLDSIKVDAYGSKMPLNQVAALTLPEPRVIAIQPWDPQMLAIIEKAILGSDVGVTPSSDGKVIRLPFAPLTEEKRKDLVKQVKKIAEEFKVGIRNDRRDANDILKKQKNDKEISEDEMNQHQKEVQKLTDDFVKEIDEIAAGKEKEVMEV